MQTFWDELIEPWKNLPRTVGLYAIVSVLGTLALVFVHVLLPGKPLAPVPRADHEQKILPKSSPAEGEKTDLISSWDAVRYTNDVVLLNRFITQFPSTQFSEAAWDRMDQLIQGGALKLAGETEGLDILSNVLQHKKDKSSAALKSFINYYGFDRRYPLGFAIFYTDGSRILYSSQQNNPNSSFDPSTIKILKMTPSGLCFAGFVWNGTTPLVLDRDCISGPPGSVTRFISTEEVIVSFESLGMSQHGAGWVIGLSAPRNSK